MLPDKIKKRNGDIVDFNAEKIQTAIGKAMTAVRGQPPSGASPRLAQAPAKRVATGGPYTAEARKITESVLTQIEGKYSDRIPSVEDVQDMVEVSLMEHRFFDVAKAYIVYRSEHQKIREEKRQETLEKIDRKELAVVRADGKKERFDKKKLREAFQEVARGFEKSVDVEALTEQCTLAVYDGISTRDIERAMVLTARSFIERDPSYDTLARRLFLRGLMREVAGKKVSQKEWEREYRESFVKNITRGVELGRLTPEMLTFDLAELARALDMGTDTLFTYRGAQTLYDRYFMRDDPDEKGEERRLEMPQIFWMRVAMGLALLEKDKMEKAKEFYETISSMRFTPSTPTLFHAGTAHPQLSSCYLTTVEDDLHHIFKCIGDNAQLSKWSGGLGNDWTNLRGMGALIKKTHVESQGVIPFLKIANDTTVAINRSGKRRGATCAYLETWHYDIEDFLDLRKNTGDERRRTHDMNTANWIPDLFMQRVMEDGDWTLFSSDEVPDLHHVYGQAFKKRYEQYEQVAKEGNIKLWKKLRAKELWRRMITALFETGHPWVTFKDPCNIRSPQDHVGVVHSSNLCTEITLNTSKDETAVCNLGSVNLARHINNGKLDTELLATTVKTAMRMLDNVIDINFYPTPEAKNANMKHRPVGLGIMAFQDALYMLNIPFDSEACVRFADESMEAVSFHAILASSELARERGTYQTYRGSKWDRGIFPVDTLNMLAEERGASIDVPREGKLDWASVREAVRQYGMRNSNCLAIAPTATISNITGCFPCIEPIYKNLYVKSNMSGEFTVANQYLVEDLKKLGLWDADMLELLKRHDGSIQQIERIPAQIRAKYKEVFEIEPEWLVRAAAHRGKWIDQSQSFNIFSKTTSGNTLSEIYFLAWNMGLKTTYYLRTMAASGVEKSTLDINKKFEGKTSQAQPAPLSTPLEVSPRGAAGTESTRPLTGLTPVAELKKEEHDSAGDVLGITTPNLCLLDDPMCEACQ